MDTPKTSVTNTKLVFTEVSWGHTVCCCWENIYRSGHLRDRAIACEDQVCLQRAGRSSAVGVTISYLLKLTPRRKDVTEGRQLQIRWVVLVLAEGTGKKRLHGASFAYSYGASQVQDPTSTSTARCPRTEATYPGNNTRDEHRWFRWAGKQREEMRT